MPSLSDRILFQTQTQRKSWDEIYLFLHNRFLFLPQVCIFFHYYFYYCFSYFAHANSTFIFSPNSDWIQFHSCIRFCFIIFTILFYFNPCRIWLSISSNSGFFRPKLQFLSVLKLLFGTHYCGGWLIEVYLLFPFDVCLLGCIRHCWIHCLNIVLLNFVFLYIGIFQRPLLGFFTLFLAFVSTLLFFMLGNTCVCRLRITENNSLFQFCYAIALP